MTQTSKPGAASRDDKRAKSRRFNPERLYHNHACVLDSSRNGRAVPGKVFPAALPFPPTRAFTSRRAGASDRGRHPEVGKEEIVLAFDQVFGVPAGHVLRQVSPAPGAAGTVGSRPGPWEHEEYDDSGRLVAVYESWPRPDGGLAYTKYSPQGWVLCRHDGAPPAPSPVARRLRVVGVA
jgi:hypothetical protein